jgi:hypothetical protein
MICVLRNKFVFEPSIVLFEASLIYFERQISWLKYLNTIYNFLF